MNFIEATSSGRDFRYPDMKEGCYFGFEGAELREFFADGGNSFPAFNHKSFIRDDYEFVEPEVIEVIEEGDEAQQENCPLHVCELLYIAVPLGKPFDAQEGIFVNGSCSCREPINKFTLVSKGPQIHTFEGVTAQMTKHDSVPTFFDSDGRNLPKRFLDKANTYVKTYTITATEEVSDG